MHRLSGFPGYGAWKELGSDTVGTRRTFFSPRVLWGVLLLLVVGVVAFLPVLYVAGFAAATGRELDQPVSGYAYGSLSMTCHTAGVPCPETAKGLPGAAPVGTDVPPEESNL